jgi:hypothetical protein
MCPTFATKRVLRGTHEATRRATLGKLCPTATTKIHAVSVGKATMWTWHLALPSGVGENSAQRPLSLIVALKIPESYPS